ncbi:PTS beta-glucoside transporter subunit IIABC, partial [Streptococcus pyogenes]
GAGSLDIDEGDGPKGNLFDRFVDLISGIFQPSLGALAAAGIIKGVVAIMANLFKLNADNSALYVILNAAGDGFFQFLPIVLAYNA